MENILGRVVTAMIIDKNEKFLFAQKDGITLKVVDKNPTDYEIGSMLEGFVYINQKDEYVMMTEVPKVREERYGWGEVVAVQHDLGVFVDVGWLGKDLVISLDHLPVLKNIWPRKGDKLFVTVTVDEKNRMWGRTADVDHYIALASKGTEKMHNDDVDGVVVASLKAGSYVWLENDLLGFIHPNEREEEPRLGLQIAARVIGLREDGVLYLSLLPRAHEVLDQDAAMILEVIKRAEGHRIAYHDKSDPDDIRAYFGISKGQFKRAVGRLMKANLVKQDEDGTYMTEQAKKSEL